MTTGVAEPCDVWLSTGNSAASELLSEWPTERADSSLPHSAQSNIAKIQPYERITGGASSTSSRGAPSRGQTLGCAGRPERPQSAPPTIRGRAHVGTRRASAAPLRSARMSTNAAPLRASGSGRPEWGVRSVSQPTVKKAFREQPKPWRSVPTRSSASDVGTTASALRGFGSCSHGTSPFNECANVGALRRTEQRKRDQNARAASQRLHDLLKDR